MIGPLPLVSIVLVTYDRLVTLKPTLASLLSNTSYPRERLELIVADDASPDHVQAEIRSLPFDRFCMSKTRGGLGANTNRGLREATGDYILQLQDDWRCLGPPDYLDRAIAILSATPDIGMLILNQHPNDLPVRDMREIAGSGVRIFDNQPDTEVEYVGRSAYTDWPHLKRRRFVESVGFYKEGVPMWTCELDYARRVNRQMLFFVADQPGVSIFEHIGADHSYNTGPTRARLAKYLKKHPATARILTWYRSAKTRWSRQDSH